MIFSIIFVATRAKNVPIDQGHCHVHDVKYHLHLLYFGAFSTASLQLVIITLSDCITRRTKFFSYLGGS